MLVYLDTCSLQRPLDDRSHPRVHLEAEAILEILALCEAGEIEMVASEVLQFEIERVPDTIRQAHAYEALSKATSYVDSNETVIARAQGLHQEGIQPLDAFHLASALEAGADFFCTCDDRLLRRSRSLQIASIKIVSPLDLIVELGL